MRPSRPSARVMKGREGVAFLAGWGAGRAMNAELYSAGARLGHANGCADVGWGKQIDGEGVGVGKEESKF